MLFSLKSPLKRKLSANEIHQCQESLLQSAPEKAFVGASLRDRSGFSLDLDASKVIRISGNFDTYAPELGIRFIGRAIERNFSILMLDFQIAEEYWHKFWALSFYFDRAKAFRLFDLAKTDRSDFLANFSEHPNAQNLKQNYQNEIAALLGTEKPVDLENHLKNAGLAALSISGVSDGSASCDAFDPEKEKFKKLAWNLAQPWVDWPDVLVVFGWDELSLERQQQLLSARLEHRKNQPRLILVQNAYSFTPEDGEFADPQQLASAYEFNEGFSELLFRQRNSLPDNLMKALHERATANGLGKVTTGLNASLDALDDHQCLALEGSSLDLLQTGTGDGLPWPPDYKPLRSRYPGN